MRWICKVLSPMLGMLALAGMAHGEFTYDFTGNAFDSTDAPYTASDSLSGSITLPLPLAPNLMGRDIAPALMDLNFDDGVQVRSAADTAICAFLVTTDGTGQIVDWTISLRELPLPPLGEPQGFIDSGSFGDSVGRGPAGTTPCDTLIPSISATTTTAGTWLFGGPPGSPTTYDYLGEPFQNAPSPYTLTDRISGSVTLTAPLPALNPLEMDLAPFLVDFAFNDGVQTRSVADSAVCALRLGTGTAGDIANWQLSLRELPLPMLGTPQQFMDITTDFDQAGEGPAGTEPCSGFLPGLLANNVSPGDWTNDPASGPLTVYQYRGLPFTTVDPPYSTQDRMVGSFVIEGALPADLPLTDISLLLRSMDYSDGVQNRTLADSDLCRFQIGTDLFGNIDDWRVSLRESPMPPMGQPQAALDSAPSIDQGSIIPAGATLCENAIPTALGSNAGGGRWFGGPPRAIPAVSVFSLLALAFGLAAVGVRVLHPR